jgi:hypothetical protein
VSKVLGGDPKGLTFTYTNGKTVIVRNIDVCASLFLSLLLISAGPRHRVHLQRARWKGYCRQVCAIRLLYCICRSCFHPVVSHLNSTFTDTNGTVRIWDTTQAEHILKYEYTVLSGAVRGMC